MATTPPFEALLDAATRLLAAREDQMLTDEEWQVLQDAVDACTPPEHRSESFRIDRDNGDLVRSVVPTKGTPYEHRCTLDNYERVAHCIDDQEGDPVTIEKITEAEVVPMTQVAVALAFLKERGTLKPVHGRKHAAATEGVHTDAMLEYHFLKGD